MPDQYDDMAYLGKTAADGYEPGMEAPAWDKVLGRLEEEMPVRKRKLWGFWWVLPVLLLPMALNEGKVFRGAKERENFPQEKVESFVKEKEELVARNDAATQREKKKYNSVQQPDPRVSTQQQQDRIPATVKKNAESGFQPSVTPVQHTIKYQNTPQNNNFSANTEEAQTLRRSVAKYEAIASNPNTTLAATNQQFTQVSIPPRFTQKVLEQKKYEIEGNPSDSNTVSLNRKQTAMHKRWEVALVTGADLSSDGLTRKDNPGWNIGIMAGYNISAHWTIRTGLIRTKKNYTVDGDQYDFKYASAYPNHKLTTVSGDCAMWEIPLNVRWMARPESKISPFLSGGLSTYLMTKERYTYSFTNPYDTLRRNMGYNETKTYPLGVVHLSAGLHTRINNHLSVSIEPFAKIPLQDLGSGNLRLLSLGGYGMVHWRF